jgi:hypothetical protein
MEHPFLEEIGHFPGGQVHAVLDLGGQLVGRPLGDPLAPLDRLVDISVATGPRVAPSRHPDLPPVGPLLADAPGNEISLTGLG